MPQVNFSEKRKNGKTFRETCSVLPGENGELSVRPVSGLLDGYAVVGSRYLHGKPNFVPGLESRAAVTIAACHRVSGE